MERITRSWTQRRSRRRLRSLALLVLALGGSAHAARMVDGEGGGGSDDGGGEVYIPPCIDGASGTIRATPTSVLLGQSTTVSWTAAIPSGCQMQVYMNGELVGASGVRTVTPQASATYRLRASQPGVGSKDLAAVPVAVALPADPNYPGRQLVQITANTQAPLFVQALGTPNTTVVVESHVQLDLTYRESIAVASGVILRGTRGGLDPGPRLFTTTRPRPLFNVVGNSVRITGVRIEGPDMGADERYGTNAIRVDGKTAIEIDHNEISGWAGSGIRVHDEQGVMHPAAPYAVHIHDNFIHHNQAVGGDGYGVVVGYGGYPLIERNVFDWNRHAIAGDGRPGTGYVATDNLVLEHGGLHRWIPFPGFWVHTHQFDMHGMYDCGVATIWSDALGNCGPAGHSMYIRRNTFFYGNDEAIKLRGTPQLGMFVGQNVFANHLSFDSATAQEEHGLVQEPGNVFGYNGKLALGHCDFDGDGVDDAFMATGMTWWYSSGGTRPWTFLDQNVARLPDLELGYFDLDNRCDVRFGGVVFSGGTWSSGGVGGGGVLAN